MAHGYISGRTRVTEFSIQGLSEDAKIHNLNGDQIFVNFDWVSADFRVASIMSGDKGLIESFEHSDPYTYMAEKVNVGAEDNPLTRDEAKIFLLKSLNSLDAEHLDFYPDLRDWMISSQESIRSSGKLSSMLGRTFHVSGERTERSVFNAVVQGSVAHAMQAVIRKVWDVLSDQILTENHDSLVLTAKPSDVPAIIKIVVEIMTRPFAGILDGNPVFPVVVSIGKQYKLWKRFKRFGDNHVTSK